MTENKKYDRHEKVICEKKLSEKLVYNQSAKYHLQMTRNALQNKIILFAKK